MKQNPDALFLYSTDEDLSNPKAVLEWPQGLSSPPVVFPLGNSFEQSEEIRRLFEGLLDTGSGTEITKG